MTDRESPGASRSCYLSTLELHELDEACHPFLEAFGEHPYLVGSAMQRPDFRDVDVRLILPDDEFDALFAERKGLWALLSRFGATYLRAKTGLPVDFQVQRQSEANEKFGDLGATPRNPLGIRSLLTFAGGGDAAPNGASRAGEYSGTAVPSPEALAEYERDLEHIRRSHIHADDGTICG